MPRSGSKSYLRWSIVVALPFSAGGSMAGNGQEFLKHQHPPWAHCSRSRTTAAWQVDFYVSFVVCQLGLGNSGLDQVRVLGSSAPKQTIGEVISLMRSLKAHTGRHAGCIRFWSRVGCCDYWSRREALGTGMLGLNRSCGINDRKKSAVSIAL